MKILASILIVTAGLACGQSTTEISNQRVITQMQQILILQQAMQGTAYQSQDRDNNAIYQAYPNNPEMWRYLNRNPRYVDYYLGR